MLWERLKETKPTLVSVSRETVKTFGRGSPNFKDDQQSD
jgi:hypothetical protein